MGPGGRHEVPTETACGGPAEHSIPPGIAKAEGVVSAEPDAVPGKATGAASGSPERKSNDQMMASIVFELAAEAATPQLAKTLDDTGRS